MTYNLVTDIMGGSIKANNAEFEYDNENCTGSLFSITLPLSESV